MRQFPYYIQNQSLVIFLKISISLCVRDRERMIIPLIVTKPSVALVGSCKFAGAKPDKAGASDLLSPP